MEKEQLFGFEALYDAMNLCKRKVMWKDSVAYFCHNYVRELLKLEEELENGTYVQRKPHFFETTEPKRRVIMSTAFRDRIVQRSLDENLIKPKLKKMLIYDNYACQSGKGTEMARNRLKCFMQRHYRKYGMEGYILKGDIAGYYPNMRHDIVEKEMKIIFREDYKHLKSTMDYFPGDVGYNPGSQIIQDVGLFMLNSMDHMVKEKLKIKSYGRYMDDFVLVAKDIETLKEAKTEIEKHISEKGMMLNKKKTKIYKLTDGVLYLGYVFRLTESGKVIATIDPQKVKHERRKLRRMVNLAKKGNITKERVDEHYKSWRSTVLSFGNTCKVIQRTDKYYKGLWREKYENQENVRNGERGKGKRKSCGRKRKEQVSDRVHGDDDGC